MRRREINASLQQNKLDLIRSLDTAALERFGHDQQVESAIANYELAARMQLAVPDLMDLSGESKETQEAYGMFSDFNNTTIFGRQCLLARRLVERGVRFVQLTCRAGMATAGTSMHACETVTPRMQSRWTSPLPLC